MHLIGGLCVALVLLALVGLLWVFYPAITCRIEKKYPTQGQQDQLFISIGKCDENQQLYVEPTCDVSIVVPAYNEVWNTVTKTPRFPN